MDHEEPPPNVAYRNDRRAACAMFFKVMQIWKKMKPTLPQDVWKKVYEEAIQSFMDEWDARGRALGLLAVVACTSFLSIFFFIQ